MNTMPHLNTADCLLLLTDAPIDEARALMRYATSNVLDSTGDVSRAWQYVAQTAWLRVQTLKCAWAI